MQNHCLLQTVLIQFLTFKEMPQKKGAFQMYQNEKLANSKRKKAMVINQTPTAQTLKFH